MTIIQPKKNKRLKANPIGIFGLLFMVALTGANAIVYTKTVTVKHDIQIQQKSLESVRAENASLKNNWYEAIDPNNIQTLVKKYDFVKITSPRYLPS